MHTQVHHRYSGALSFVPWLSFCAGGEWWQLYLVCGHSIHDKEGAGQFRWKPQYWGPYWPPPQTKKVKCEEIHLPFQPNHSAVKGRQHTYTKGMEHHLKFSESLRDIMKAMTAHPFLVSQNPHWVRLATAGSFFFFEQFPVKEAGQEGS